MILKGVLDVIVTRGSSATAGLLTSCGGAPYTPLSRVTEGPATLVHGKASFRTKVVQEEGSECLENLIAVGARAGRILGLKSNRRYRVVFDTTSRVMSFFVKPVTTEVIPIRIGRQVIEGQEEEARQVTIQNNQLYVSEPGVFALGIIGDRLLVQHGLKSRQLRIKYGGDIFASSFLQVTPQTAARLGITAGNTRVSFNQNRSVLRIITGK